MAPPSKITLYTAGTPNGQKISITLEELGLEYDVYKIDFTNKVQKESWYLKINPNGRIPALIDSNNPTTPPLFEGASIQLYLTTHYDPKHTLSFPHDTPEYWECMNWLIWMQSGIGPMQGQANHFYRYAPKKIDYAIERYQTETRRLYQVLEQRLTDEKGRWGVDAPYIVGGKYSIADICCFSWINWAEWAGIDTKPFPTLDKWLKTIQERPAVAKGCDVPDKFEMKEAMKTPEGAENFAKYHSNWVMQGMKEDQETHE